MSLRLLGGELRGRRIKVPPGVRPTEARAREALFSIWRQRTAGSRFLDLFTGSGAVGFEAFSQGASRVVMVERARRVVAALHASCQSLAVDCEIVRGRLPEVLERVGGVFDSSPFDSVPFDLVFADPPYAFADYTGLIAAAARCTSRWGEIAVEHSTRVDISSEVTGWHCRDCKRYGESCLSFFRSDDRS